MTEKTYTGHNDTTKDGQHDTRLNVNLSDNKYKLGSLTKKTLQYKFVKDKVSMRMGRQRTEEFGMILELVNRMYHSV